MKRLHLPFLVALCLLMASVVSASKTEAASISVKLVNYLGNRSSVDFDTDGTFKLANNNSRLAGADRFEVAANVADQGWEKAETVLVVNYLAFADALAAAPLAYKYNAPILLTAPNTLNDLTEKKIKELGASKVYIIGGTGSVSSTVESRLKSFASVERIPGRDRFEVAKNVSSELGTSSKAVVANGLVFSDALAIAPYAAKNGIPILLTAKDSIPQYTLDAMKGKSGALVIGGTGSVSSSVFAKLDKITSSIKRIAGKDRYEVSANILKDSSLGLNADTVFLSSGQTFADALTGSVLAAKQGSPLLLTSSQDLPDIIKRTLIDVKTSIVTILGGTASVSDSVVKELPNEYYLVSGAGYSAKLVNGNLVLYKGTTIVKNFGSDSFTLTSSYSSSNRLNINSGTPRTYLGTIEFNKEGSYIKPVNKNIPFEDYLKGVVPREMPASWNEEALKAQAVAARTFSIDEIGKTVVDSQGYQVYGGYTIDPYTDKIARVVDATKGQVLRDSTSKLITALFTSSNGGMRLNNTNTYGNLLAPYLTLGKDDYDLAADNNPYKSWSYKVSQTQIDMTGKDLSKPGDWWSVQEKDAQIATNMKDWLTSWKDSNGNLYVSPSFEIKIVKVPLLTLTTSFDASDTIMGSITLKYFLKDKNTGSYVMENGKIKENSLTINRRAYDIRAMIGSDIMRSPYITKVDSVSTPGTFIVTGGGWGHGMGMSQYGANEMGKQGNGYANILHFYYPGATLGN